MDKKLITITVRVSASQYEYLKTWPNQMSYLLRELLARHIEQEEAGNNE